MFKHYIFTRFNLLNRETDIYNNPDIPDPETWMAHRIKLFEKYTLAGMLRQTNKNFTWLLAFSEKTPKDIIKKYDYLDNVKIIYQYPLDWMKRQTPEAEYIITSRIDNDDYYHPLFIEMIQTWAINSQPYTGIIDIDYTQLDHATGEHYSSQRNTANSPFISLVESWDKDIKTVFHCSHTNMMNHFNHYKINMRMATMVIHDRNISNKIVGDKL